MSQNPTTTPPDVLLHMFIHIKWLIMLLDKQLKSPISLPVHHPVQRLLPLQVQRNHELMISWLPFQLLRVQAQSQWYQMVHQCYPTLINNVVPLRSLYPSFPQLLLPLLCLPFCHHPLTQCYRPQTLHKHQPPLSYPHYLQTPPL